MAAIPRTLRTFLTSTTLTPSTSPSPSCRLKIFRKCYGTVSHFSEMQPKVKRTSLRSTLHQPVMLDEVIEAFDLQDGQVFVDMTFGAGGHSRALLDKAPNARFFALDRDPVANQLAQEFAEQNCQVTPLLGRFSELHQLLSTHGIGEGDVDAVLMDLGASSMQFDEAQRGFSLSKDGPLDMRMDRDRFPDQPSAADVVNYVNEKSLVRILKKYGEEKQAQLVAHAIIDSRYAFGKITSTVQLADIVATAFPSSFVTDKIGRKAHVATRTFQALRIFVNNELNEVNNGLEICHRVLRPGGTCVVLSFHSLEDRIAKRHFHGIDMDEKLNLSLTSKLRGREVTRYSQDFIEKVTEKCWRPFSRKITMPTQDEVSNNPRARSAKMRVAVKLK